LQLTNIYTIFIFALAENYVYQEKFEKKTERLPAFFLALANKINIVNYAIH